MQNFLQTAQETANEWINSLLTNIPTIIGVAVVVFIFYLLAKLGQKITRKTAKRSGAPRSLQVLLSNSVKLVVLIAGLIIALNMLGLSKAVTTALAGAGILGIVLGFALQDIASNFISGIILIFRKPFREGDIVEISGHIGVVQEINLRTTKLQSLSGEIVYIPNQQVFQNDLVNHNEYGKRRVDITCGVSYDDDLKKARELAIEAINSLGFVDTADSEVEFYYEEFGGSSINFTLRFWINFSQQPDFLAGKSEAIEIIKSTFEENDIDIPFPVRTININKNNNGGFAD